VRHHANTDRIPAFLPSAAPAPVPVCALSAGVFFNYELSPMRVRIEERRNSLLHFLTRVFAIIGGVFTVRAPRARRP